MLAFGMGKTVVDGGTAFRFCPAKPQIPVTGINGRSSSQRRFYALDRNIRFNPEKDIDNLVELDLAEAEKWKGAQKGVMSTLRPDGFMSEDPSETGFKTLTFNGVVKYGMLSLADIIHDILELGTRTMAEPVEIEFAVNTEHDFRPDFSILQLRPISSTDRFEDIEVSAEDERNAVIFAPRVMGNGRVKDIHDIVIFRKDAFRRSEMTEMARELEEMNASSDNEYILVAAGRLGSSDPWLGIPCSWSQISKAHVIVETGTEEIQAEPSEGTHFFQNVTSLGCLYLTVNPLLGRGKVDFGRIYGLAPVKSTKHFLRLTNGKAFSIKADGQSGRAVISIEGDGK